ncbi:MAG TPA: ABC transporter permease [Candidatus Acidoferrum sp.]|nr:ABC transporter permease [Candidatus Acidoferrum sp.]
MSAETRTEFAADTSVTPRQARRARGGSAFRGPVLAVVFGAVFVLAWKLITLTGWFKAFVLPAPETVASRFVRAWSDGTMVPHTTTTLVEVLLGFAIGASVGLILGYALARSRVVAQALSPYLVAAQATPILALAPLIALWFGTGLLSKVVICGLIVFFPVAISTMVGIRSVDGQLLELCRSLRATRVQVLTRVEIPAALPAIFGGLRVGVTLAVVGAVIGEWAGGDTGLGVLINLAKGSLFDTPLLFATLATLALLGSALYLAIVLVERRLVGVRA